ncbi:MAG: hypothetical protein AAF598_19270 [Bacteroidota bacterium]
MLSIYVTTKHVQTVTAQINSIDRLNELVEIVQADYIPENTHQLAFGVSEDQFYFPLDWGQFGPPYLLPSAIEVKGDLLLGIVFGLLGNLEVAAQYCGAEPNLFIELELRNQLQVQELIKPSDIHFLIDHQVGQSGPEQHRLAHNISTILHFGHLQVEVNVEELAASYEAALGHSTDNEAKAFTAWQFSGLLNDLGHRKAAEQILLDHMEESLADPARYALQAALIRCWMDQLTVPYNTELMDNLKSGIWETLKYFESVGRLADAGILYLDAAHIANVSESFTESLGYVQKAIGYFQGQGLPELIGHAQMHKGRLMYAWAQNGNPQFFKPATEAYHEALKVFTKEAAPDVFAEIQHQLGLLYAEMPAEVKKKSIWAGVSNSSFLEALEYYNSVDYPYEYAMICNNYGNALCKFPQAIHSDNYEKALFYYQESLNHRDASFPIERALTLLNFLEASWNVSNQNEQFNVERYQDMHKKVNEILSLVGDGEIREEAQKHMEMLNALNETVSEQ